MSSKTKIVVLHLKELIYTGIFILLGILFIVLLVIMFLPKDKKDDSAIETMSLFVPGVYTSSLILNDMAVDIEVAVDENNINSLCLVNLDEAITTMFPLIEPSFENIASQITSTQSLENITYDQDKRYTTMTLIDAIEAALLKAQAPLDTNE
ncbi:MAG TPA: hypothetical protein VJZ04_06510 [Lachnospiraceae bacterium]|nr:hypothetical protein [Lachnospiraceae bacterium]